MVAQNKSTSKMSNKNEISTRISFKVRQKSEIKWKTASRHVK